MMPSIILTGSPNSGKSLMFNRLTGLSQKVANFPGITADAMFGIYFFGMFCALLVTSAVSRTAEDHYSDMPFVLELPPYRVPGLVPILRNAWNRSKHFVTKAGKIIFVVTVVIWVLGYFPN